MDNCSGTFEILRCKENLDFYAQCGISKEALDNFVGKCEQAKFCSFDGKRSAHYTCKELPEFSEFYVYCLGQEMEICNQMFGGKCKVKVCKTGDACFETTVESPTLGCMKIVDKFCKEGIDRCVTMKGKTQKEHWKRVICENGCYRLCKSENVKEFMKAEGLPEKMICMMDDFKIKWKVCDNRFDLVRCFGGMKIESGGCFDEELCEVAMEGIPASKYIVTKTGCGKYKSLVRDEKGGKAEWCMEFFEGGLCMKGKNMKTGMSCSMEFMKYVPLAGTWKMICCENIKENLCALGMPSEKAHQLSCDIATSCTEIEDHCPVFRWNWKCKSCPMDFCFKLDEEFEHFNHAMQQTCKGTITCVSDCGKTAKFKGVFKYSGGSVWTQCMTITEHFMIMKSQCLGMNCPPLVYIMERQC